jgi:hypothetical protein
MRLLNASVALPLLALLAMGCNTVDPSECWPNTSGGFGGSGTIPIGAGVGATSSGDFTSPGPNGGTPNPCIAAPVSDSPGAKMPSTECLDPGGTGEAGGVAPAPGDDAISLCSAACSSKCGSAPHGFSPSIFVFTTTVVDDGKGLAGGWQVGSATLHFSRWTTTIIPEVWSCSVTAEMPVRAAADGVIPPKLAATMTAQVATTASFAVMNSTPELPPGIYCFNLIKEMKAEFPTTFPGLGAKVN